MKRKKNANANPNKNGEDKHWGLISYDNNEWKCELGWD